MKILNCRTHVFIEIKIFRVKTAFYIKMHVDHSQSHRHRYFNTVASKWDRKFVGVYVAHGRAVQARPRQPRPTAGRGWAWQASAHLPCLWRHCERYPSVPCSTTRRPSAVSPLTLGQQNYAARRFINVSCFLYARRKSFLVIFSYIQLPYLISLSINRYRVKMGKKIHDRQIYWHWKTMYLCYFNPTIEFIYNKSENLDFSFQHF